MNKDQKRIEKLENDITSLKIRLRRVEDYIMQMPNPDDFFSQSPSPYSLSDFGDDDLYEKAVEEVRQYDHASASLLQRKLQIGYARASRLLDMLEAGGIIGPANGSKPRDVIQTENNKQKSG